MGNIELSQIDLYKDIMSGFPTGVTIITTTDENNNPVGLTINSFTSVSLEPLLVSWCIAKTSDSLKAFQNSAKFAVNILSGSQEKECFIFANKKDKDRFSKVQWEMSQHYLPLLQGVYAVFECEKIDEIEAGDHYILIGKVFNLTKYNENPMLYYRRKVGSVAQK